jgi:DNA polymerase III subunit beta
MTVEVSAIELSKAVSIASRASNSKVNTGYPNAFRLTATSGDKALLTLSAFDLSTAIKCSITGMISSDIDVVVSSQMLKDILSSSTGDRIELTDNSKKHRLGVSSLRCNWDIGYLEPDDYPLAPELADDAAVLSVPATDLIDLLSSVVYAASTDEARPNIVAVNLEIISVENTNLIRSAATDGHRLASAEFHVDSLGGVDLHDDSIVIPAKAVRDLIAILKADEVHEDTILIEYDKSTIRFTWNDIEQRDRVIVSRLIDDTYPPYKGSISPHFANTVKINRQSLLTAINRASIIAKSSNNKIVIEFGDSCTIEAEQDLGGSIEDIEDIEVEGEAVSLIFNYKYVLDALKNIESDKINIRYNDNNSPVLIDIDDDESISAIHLLMPIKRVGKHA